ncbi:hypothetical protein L596_012709 [Steinernema carpocapsae]|uniref:Uncharacterized protein n=1 Tax=Steinernema carpocapsae TaxID=34508 RepID=A0A4U5NYJ1_STECR|nr:hypothetical protein L596_012709 [Steinernema carpocapsae]
MHSHMCKLSISNEDYGNQIDFGMGYLECMKSKKARNLQNVETNGYPTGVSGVVPNSRESDRFRKFFSISVSVVCLVNSLPFFSSTFVSHHPHSPYTPLLEQSR